MIGKIVLFMVPESIPALFLGFGSGSLSALFVLATFGGVFYRIGIGGYMEGMLKD